ncbi:putative PIN family toxin of toxin-antitoxin system [Luteibacter sp. OK325]|uniref:putative toxin-antitoxin system toxin component, PIN family n=1 Tax=Luteibacter sp. OK325 TaxID=2135670 RepID=UPI000D3689F6|nr:putative toxin-antitoxin system toxin component, PIN family [Luteibacter sp. OK325]PTR32574.1 putative PIN family toxin of toxin-antitoxin system [Luteibacter sp. OK325]
MRVVLDTNVCLDAFVFDDPRAARLVAALTSGDIEAVTRTDCRDEWLGVLAYPTLKLDEVRRTEAAARFDGLVTLLEGDTASCVSLPRCRDPDDQKFLELAATSGASVLFSRDAEVLRLGRRTVRDGLFEILKPEDWVAAR